ncbi:hypothetical protein DOTSEDRAFT_33404 [Dothistroma septosporum NZE10]|uniref:Uncharacterized protein n=1 Tax=Dothistroma septosporum (strain NZE10 / CBS 128990) TaxID=675120 RepID=N1PU11_DOTSN|nr:hypothetical protein DOTSEDRAFT_33404 [Dothistroma septosporum NZE10]
MARYRHWALGSPRIPHVGPKQQTARSILMKRYAAAQKVKITETNANITILAYQRGIARSLSNVRERPARSRLLAEGRWLSCLISDWDLVLIFGVTLTAAQQEAQIRSSEPILNSQVLSQMSQGQG